MDVDLAFLTGGVRYDRPYTMPLPTTASPAQPYPRFPDAGAALDALLAHRDVCSRRDDLPALRRRRARHDRDPARRGRCGRDLSDPRCAARRRARGRRKSALRQTRSATRGRARGARSGAQRRGRRRAAARSDGLLELRRSDRTRTSRRDGGRDRRACPTRRGGSARRSFRATSASTISRSRDARSRRRRSSRASAASRTSVTRRAWHSSARVPRCTSSAGPKSGSAARCMPTCSGSPMRAARDRLRPRRARDRVDARRVRRRPGAGRARRLRRRRARRAREDGVRDHRRRRASACALEPSPLDGSAGRRGVRRSVRFLVEVDRRRRASARWR